MAPQTPERSLAEMLQYRTHIVQLAANTMTAAVFSERQSDSALQSGANYNLPHTD